MDRVQGYFCITGHSFAGACAVGDVTVPSCICHEISDGCFIQLRSSRGFGASASGPHRGKRPPTKGAMISC